MLNKIKGKTSIIESIIIAIITFLIIFPMKQNKLLLIILTMIYMLIQLVINRKEFIEFYIKPTWIMYTIYVWIIVHIVANFIFNIPYMDAINTIACAFIMSIYLYCIKINKGIKTIASVSISSIILANIITIIELIKNPELSRIISGSNVNLVGFGIGNYSYIYGLIFVIFALIGKLYSKEIEKKYKIGILAIILLSCITIFYAKFVISYVILLFGIIMILFKIKNLKRFVIFILCTLTILLLFSGTIGNILEEMSKNTENYIIKNRISEIASIFKGTNVENLEDTNIRLNVYKNSIYTVVNNPFVGMLRGEYNENGVQAGGHSAFLDEIARLGILFALPFFVMLYFLLKNILKSINNKKGREIYFACIIAFCILGSINTIMFGPLLWMMFVVTPIMCQDILVKGEKKEENESTLDS